MWELLQKRMKWKANTNWFDKNPNNIVPWRPKKWVSAINEELKKAWYLPASKNDIEACYMSLIQLEQEQLTNIANDKSKPMLIHILAKNMLWWKWFDIIEKMLDRWIWKANQSINQEVKGEYTIKFEI